MSLDKILPASRKSGDKTKVLIFTESFHPYTSGIARRFKTIIEHLAQTNEYLIHVVSGCKGHETAWENDPFMKERVTFSSFLFTIDFKDKIECALPFLIPQPGLIYEIIKFKPDIIHCVEHTPASTFFGAIAKSFNIPIVWSSHTNLDFYLPLYIRPIASSLSVDSYQWLRRTYLNKADFNLTVSKDFSNVLVKTGITPPIHIWKTGVDEKVFNPSFRSNAMRKRMFNGQDETNRILLLSVGRLSPEKNFEFLIGLLKKFPQAFLCIVGDGPFKVSLKPLFPESQTHFMGFLQGNELAAAYASADYFVYASVSETFGQVYMEAMSSGVPIVAAEGTQMKEFFTNGEHGYTWEPNNLSSAINAMNLAIKNRDRLAKECRKNALNHSWSSAGKQIEEIYSEIKNREKETSRFNKFISIPHQLAYNFFQWLLMMLMILLVLLPFLKVSKPSDSTKLNVPMVAKNNEKFISTRTKKNTIYSFLMDQLELAKVFAAKVPFILGCLMLSMGIVYSFV